jgi:exonuclease SbcC
LQPAQRWQTFLARRFCVALAEIVAREGGRLDSFFLDEGFGSLDTEHLDLAMDGIERLVASAGDRLVVVVSHVPALRERFEDLIVLDRDAVTGVTRVLDGSGVGA